MNFIALDVETANADMASICQIGLAKYSEGELVEVWTSLINPEDYFDPINIAIHGITEDNVVDSPKFPQIVDVLKSYLNNTICVSHTHFDRVSIERVFDKYELESFEITWLDSARVARRTWKDCAWKGYGLANVCEKIGYRFQHLVVGDQDILKLAGKEKSSKHYKAEQLILKGQKIRIIKESDFKKLVIGAGDLGAKYSKIEVTPKLNQKKCKKSDIVHSSREGIYIEFDIADFYPQVIKDRKAKTENRNK